jgi:hypothetical protein
LTDTYGSSSDEGGPISVSQTVTVSLRHRRCLAFPEMCPDVLTCDAFSSFAEAEAAYRVDLEAALLSDYRAEEDAASAEPEPSPFERSVYQNAGTTWAPIDLTPYTSGKVKPVEPDFLRRSDGAAMFYKAKTNKLFGPSENGKTWVVLVALAEVLLDGGAAVVVDFEDDASGFVERMLALGVTPEALTTRCAYIRPEDPFFYEDKQTDTALGFIARADFYQACEALNPDIIVLDGVTEAMMLHDLNDNAAVDVAKFNNMLPRKLQNCGAAVVVIDHTPHEGDREIGSQHKKSSTTGASFLVTSRGPIIRGRPFTLDITVKKDRPGRVRPNAAGGKDFGSMTVSPVPDGPRPGTLEVVFNPPKSFSTVYRPGPLMERVSRWIEENPGMATGKVRDGVGRAGTDMKEALGFLEHDGYAVSETRGIGVYWTSVKPYRDPTGTQSDATTGTTGT